MEQQLLQIAKQTHAVDPARLEQLLRKRHEDSSKDGAHPQDLDAYLLNCGIFTEDQVLRLFSELLGVPFVEQIVTANVPQEFVARVTSTTPIIMACWRSTAMKMP